ncbi:hypothetical protein [Epinotia aporema granulovirus]|uniref:Uncharacterized protein n=1 Tax=Epinotia aporema granulovirus TaxID=166056 RepID=K4EQU6_9BBAC|nr:hypothetical protein [Epinotia aporema granulovirus]AER41551.1 hypothetical protein [Epinotia aporema granulovirus]
MDNEPKLSFDNEVKRRNSNGSIGERRNSNGSIGERRNSNGEKRHKTSLVNKGKELLKKISRRPSQEIETTPETPLDSMSINNAYGMKEISGVTMSETNDYDKDDKDDTETMDVDETETMIDSNLHHLMYINGIDIGSVPHVYIAKAPFLPTELDEIQLVMDKYFNNVINMNMSVYLFLQMSKGDYSVGYYYFTKLLRSLNMNAIKYEYSRKVMYKMYMDWAENVCKLFGLVINANGASPVKEIMNIINQSVYSFLKFVAKPHNLPMLFFDNIYQLPKNDINTLDDEMIQQRELTDFYNQKIVRCTHHNQFRKFTKEEKVTGVMFMGETKLVNVTPTYKKVKSFNLIK